MQSGTATVGNGEIAEASYITLGRDKNSLGILKVGPGGIVRPQFDIYIAGTGPSPFTPQFNGSSQQNGGGGLLQSGGAVTACNIPIGMGSTGEGSYLMSGGTLTLNNIATASGQPLPSYLTIGTRFFTPANLAPRILDSLPDAVFNQSAGDVLVKDLDAATFSQSMVNLGQTGPNAGSGHAAGECEYLLNGTGRLSVPSLIFGTNATGATVNGGSNTFTLSDTAVLSISKIEFRNPNALNTFNFNGGMLTANSIGTAAMPISLANNSGTLSPGHGGPDLAFSGNADFTGGDLVGTTTLNGTANYSQTPASKLRIDFASNARADKVVLGGAATIAGTLDLHAAGAATGSATPVVILTAIGGVTGKFTTVTGHSFTNANGKSRELVPTYDANNVYVVATLPGDANLDGKVTVGDLGILATNFNGSGKEFQQGDFNFDGSVTVGDLGILATFFNQDVNAGNIVVGDGPKTFAEAMAMPEFAALNAAVPEPASFGLLVVGAAGMLLRRRRISIL